MRFYYFSLLSWMVYAVYGAIAITLVSLLWTKVLKLKLRNPAYWVLAVAILAAPWMEEFWIAYNFDRLCRKDAGVFINKTVQVDGYYNDTGTITRLVGGPPYKFIESPEGNGRYRRVEHATEQEKAAAIAWYAKSKGKQPGEKEWFTQQVSKDLRVIVEMDTGNAWRITMHDKPTARYQYRTPQRSAPVSHKIRRTEHIVGDSQTGELLARETMLVRDAYWFFIALDAPVMPCPDSRERPQDPKGMLYENALIPKTGK